MPKLVQKYRSMTFEQKTVLHAVIGLCFSATLALSKLVIGILTDYSLCIVAAYTFAILISKLQCVLGTRPNKLAFKTRNILISVFLFISSAVYIGLMCRMLFIEHVIKSYGFLYTVLLAFISFAELGFAIAGIIRTKNKGHLYRDIKIINFCIALTAILTTQITILDFTATADTNSYNAYTGIAVGCFIALCAVYILIAPYTSVIGREHNVFILNAETKIDPIPSDCKTFELVLCRSFVYGSYVYRATVDGNVVDGYIERDKSLWKRMHVALKILCCILSEILIFVWIIGRLVFFVRSAALPTRLEKKMEAGGFAKL